MSVLDRKNLFKRQVKLDNKLVNDLEIYYQWEDKKELPWLFSATIYLKSLGDNHIKDKFYQGDGIYFQIENFPERQMQNIYHIKIVQNEKTMQLDKKTEKEIKRSIGNEAYKELIAVFNKCRLRLLFIYSEVEELKDDISKQMIK